MAFKIVRNDITKMNTEAIVNTANELPVIGTGCDSAIYKAAGADELLEYRKKSIGEVHEGEVFITPGFNLSAKYIIHAVSPLYESGNPDSEEKLRSCYRKSLKLAQDHNIQSIAFPLISTGGFGYPKEEGMRIAVDEINAFLLQNDMMIYLVVFDDKSSDLGKRIYTGLEEYIDRKFVEEKKKEEYLCSLDAGPKIRKNNSKDIFKRGEKRSKSVESIQFDQFEELEEPSSRKEEKIYASTSYLPFELSHESKLEERMEHLSDTFSEYLLYLIQEKNLENADVYKRAIVDKKTFSKIKNNVNYHPQKLTALCLCIGAKLNMDESKDLLARAGYALSPCDKTDIIFSYFIENEIYDMIELDIQLEEHGLPCIIT